MAKKKTKLSRQLLRWSKSVPASEVQDPLGLGLRGSTRLASRLLFCITSITPRARYFSFIPWCIYNFQQHEKGQAHAQGLREAIKLRETALTLACVLHHDGQPCDGGALVGSTRASKWDASSGEANFRKLDFAKVPALDAYYNSLVNLRCFVTDEEREDTDEDGESVDFTFDDIELSEVGLRLAKTYESLVGRLESVREIASKSRKCSVNSLREWGKRGGLCELADSTAQDQPVLRDLFFAKSSKTNDSHTVRNRSLVLILELCRQLSADGWCLDVNSFGMAAYYGEVVNDDGEQIRIEWPSELQDIADRWRMFYFHHYMSVALEGMFAWLVSTIYDKGVSGSTTAELAESLNDRLVHDELGEFLETAVAENFGDTLVSDLFKNLGVDCESLEEASDLIDQNVRAETSAAEHWLEEAIRERTYLQKPTGLAVPMILFVLALGRYRRWANTDYGNWLATAANDPYLDLVPPSVVQGLDRQLGEWWNCSWSKLTEFVLSRYVVQQHQAMAYEKTAKGDRCLLQVDGQKVVADLPHEKVGIGNPRLNSAIQVLTDLALVKEDEEGVTHLTDDGESLLQSEIAERGAG